MPTAIQIVVNNLRIQAELNDTPTAQAVVDALPITGTVQRWGQEIYFGISVEAQLAEDAREDVAVGELGYWPPGRAFCMFFGRTPASQDDQPRAASPVNVIGRMGGDLTSLGEVPAGVPIRLERG